MELTQLIGISAGVLTAASMIPQVVKMIKEKKASQVSVVMIMILISGIILWIWYGILKDDLPIILTNSFSLLINLVMIVFRIKYRDNTSN
jgi:MtN3 and saliva related transmembrane protein